MKYMIAFIVFVATLTNQCDRETRDPTILVLLKDKMVFVYTRSTSGEIVLSKQCTLREYFSH